MATDIATLQVDIRDLTRSQRLDLTSVEDLARLNRMYRWLGSLTNFPELRRSDTSTATVSGTESYTWPTTAGNFNDVRTVELQDPDDADKYKEVPKARTELEWQMQAREPNGWPLMWLDSHDGSNNIISLRPIPDFAKTLRVTGYIVPTALTSGSSTVFRTRDMDDALANLFAGDLLTRRDQPQLAQVRFAAAQQIVRRITGREITIAELAAAGHAA